MVSMTLQKKFRDNYEELSKDENLKMSVERGGTLNLFLNTTEGIMADVNMRQAILEH